MTRVLSTGAQNRVEGLAIPRPGSVWAARAGERVARLVPALPWAICVVTAIAAALRLAELDDVVGNPFYDAAIRSMSLSWHNLFFGAYDPGGLLSVDKPPLDLWFQVASVKVFGWSSFALKLPEVLGGTLAVPLLYDAVRRAIGRGAAFAAALALAVTPVSVLTSRSDTMDSLMMLFVVLALWLTVRAAAAGHRRRLVLAGIALGLAFNVKLLEGLVALPALTLLYAAGAPISRRRRARDIAFAAGAFVIVALSWATIVVLAPGSHPFPIGSSNGSVFDAMFNFNGLGRVSGALAAGGVFSAPPGPLRLLSGVGSIGRLFGCMLVAALALGAAALVVERRRRAEGEDPGRSRLAFAFSLAVIVWLGCGVVVLSYVTTLHARYLEMVTPAVAAAMGGGLASLVASLYAGARVRARARASVPPFAAALTAVCWYTSTLVSASTERAVAFAAAALIAAALAVFVERAARPAALLSGALALACCLSFPFQESHAIVRQARSDSVGLQVQPRPIEAAIWRYLGPRTVGVRYEVALDNPVGLAPLIIHDARPILPLTSFGPRQFLSLSELRRAVASGAVRYALVGRYSCGGPRPGAACVPAAVWIRQHGIKVTAAVPIPPGQRLDLYQLPH